MYTHTNIDSTCIYRVIKKYVTSDDYNTNVRCTETF
jgi:hypothetical protein